METLTVKGQEERPGEMGTFSIPIRVLSHEYIGLSKFMETYKCTSKTPCGDPILLR